MIATFTATTQQNAANRNLMCYFINEHSPECQQMTFRSVGNSLIIEGVINITPDKIKELSSQIPAKIVFWDCGIGRHIINNETGFNGFDVAKIFLNEENPPLTEKQRKAIENFKAKD